MNNFAPFFDAADLTVCVDASTTPAQLNAQGAPHHASFPLYLDPEQSFGELFLGSRFSSRSFRYGSLGDNVLGLRWQLPNGHGLDFGGRVVKNVVGFDFVRFLAASQGRFGRPQTLVLRLRPRAVAERVLRFTGPWQALKTLARLVRASSWAHAIDALDLQTDPKGASLYLSFCAKPSLLGAFDEQAERWAEASETLVSRMGGSLPARSAMPWARIQAPPDTAIDLATEWSQRYGGTVAGFLGSGTLQIEGAPSSEQGALQGLAELRDRLAPLGGHVEHPELLPDPAASQARWQAELLRLLEAV